MFFPHDLIFVDAARYADIARNILENGQFRSHFSFPSPFLPNENGWQYNLPPVPSFAVAIFFKLFGISDWSAIIQSFFFFLLGIPLVYLLAQKLFNTKAAIFSALFYMFTPQLLSYATDGASEPIFIFELLLISYLIVKGRKWSLLFAGLIMGLSLFTKLQSYLFVPIFLFWVYLINRDNLKKVWLFLIGPVLLVSLNKFGILFGSYFLDLPAYLAFQQTTLFPGDNLPRAGLATQIDLPFLIKNASTFVVKISYNLYNFYKSIFTFDNLLPAWTSPMVVISYLLSHINFLTKEKKEIKIFRIITLLMVVGSFILAGATSPSIRYAHYVLPFVIILAVDFIYGFLQRYNFSAKKTNSVLVSLLLLFMVFPFLGTTVLDARFNARAYNFNAPHVQKVMGEKVGQLTDKSEIIVTNLDTWGAWYGERRTILIPLDFVGLEKFDNKIKINAIYLTDFQRDNEDHPLKGDWGELFDNPRQIKNKFILDNFKLVKEGTISVQEVYENKPFTYKLWLRKN